MSNWKVTVHSLVTSLTLTVALLTATALSGCTSTKTPLKDVKNDPLSLGIINRKGEWIIPPVYQEVIYVKKLNAFWVKDPKPSMVRYLWPPTLLNSIGKNDHWKLLNRDGEELRSELPAGQELLREWPPRQALAVSTYSDNIATNRTEGAGLNNAHGKSLTASKFHRLDYVGDDIWVGHPGQDEDRSYEEKVFPSINLGNVLALPPALQYLDKNGQKMVTLPKGVAQPDGKFVDSMLVFMTMGRGLCVLDKTGHMVIEPGRPLPPALLYRHFQDGEPRSFNCFYNLPVSPAARVKFIDLSKKTGLLSELIPVPVTDDLALIKTQDDMYGLVNRKGEWIINPDYNRLAFCDPDRMVCSKGRLTMEQSKAQKLEIIRPDIR